jgi:hypothetical protein
LKAELNKIGEELCNEACVMQSSMDEMANIRKLLIKVSDLLTQDGQAITSYEFKHSKLL